jgi:hypothetical protein
MMVIRRYITRYYKYVCCTSKRTQNLNLWKPQLSIGYSMLQQSSRFWLRLFDPWYDKNIPFPIGIEGLSQVLYVATSAHTWPKIVWKCEHFLCNSDRIPPLKARIWVYKNRPWISYGSHVGIWKSIHFSKTLNFRRRLFRWS